MDSGVSHIFRVPYIHGVNTGEENLAAMAEFLAQAETPQTVEFLPYNEMAGAKYPLAGMTYDEDFTRPTAEDIARAKEMLAGHQISFRK
jgi:pyruvate-formate lyase-activating enzyme